MAKPLASSAHLVLCGVPCPAHCPTLPAALGCTTLHCIVGYYRGIADTQLQAALSQLAKLAPSKKGYTPVAAATREPAWNDTLKMEGKEEGTEEEVASPLKLCQGKEEDPPPQRHKGPIRAPPPGSLAFDFD